MERTTYRDRENIRILAKQIKIKKEMGLASFGCLTAAAIMVMGLMPERLSAICTSRDPTPTTLWAFSALITIRRISSNFYLAGAPERAQPIWS